MNLLKYLAAVLLCVPFATSHSQPAGSTWRIGDPIITYWGGPGFIGGAPLNKTTAQQVAAGGWNLAWSNDVAGLDLARDAGLRVQFASPLLSPETLDNPAKKAQLDALIARIKDHPALYSYFITDEPGVPKFAALARLVAYLRQADPAHLAYINLFPTYATNQQLGTKGECIPAYQDYLRQFTDTVKPDLLSWDNYQFATKTDLPQYFLNLSLIREHSLRTGLPFLNIVQVSGWQQAMRPPGQAEIRYLVYTTLAYGAQGISYFVYTAKGFEPGIALSNGTLTPVYNWLQPLNRDFLAIARQLQPLRSLGVYHAGMLPPGAVPLPADSAFQFIPAVPAMPYQSGDRVQGYLLGTFGPNSTSPATTAVVVNLDYKNPAHLTIEGPSNLEVFDPKTATWSPADGRIALLTLPPGGGKLLRLKPTK